MLPNLTIGSLLVTLTVLIHTAGLVALSRITPWFGHRLGLHGHDIGRAVIMTASVLGIFVLHTMEIWLWAAAFASLQVTSNFLNALNLSTAMFSTVGYGQSTVAASWRLLTALEGIDGFILIGWSTAYLVGVATRHGPFRKSDHF